MILGTGSPSEPAEPVRAAPGDPDARLRGAGLVIAVLRTSTDAQGGAASLRVEALGRSGPEEAWERFDERCDDPAPDALASLGSRFAAFVAGRVVIAEDPAALVALLPPEASPAAVTLTRLGQLLVPGRFPAEDDAELCARVVPAAARDGSGPRAPARLAVLGALLDELHARPPAVRALAVHGYRLALEALVARDPDDRVGRAVLEFVLDLLRHPELCAADAELAAAGPGLARVGASAGACSRTEAEHLRVHPSLTSAHAEATPVWSLARDADRGRDSVPPDPPGDHPFPAEDAQRLEEIFREHLPRLFRGPGSAPSYRAGQHAVARAIAEGLGSGELLLVHAPTGTGKTLAYLVPVLLWAGRHGVRVGVATYTRALQEQAMDREVPLALDLLERSGAGLAVRVSSLKGRHNYLCWRALELQLPTAGEAPAAIVAWTRLALFGLTSEDGDLDRFSRRPPLALGSPGEAARAADQLLALARAEGGCCRTAHDRRTCAAHAARHRAERSHVVVTNISFALASQGFFKHVVFDECEHLHEQAHAAWSHSVAFHRARELFRRLGALGGETRAGPIARLLRQALPGSTTADAARDCARTADAAAAALTELRGEVKRFLRWRDGAGRERAERDSHSLFREYATGEAADGLLAAHDRLAGSTASLAAKLADLSEHLGEEERRGRARLRRRIDVLRSALDELAVGVEAWLPASGQGTPSFRPETFYDVETDEQGRDALVARVLLPHEYLGRRYFPALAGAVCISATTWLADGFDAAASYLGLHRAAHPAEDEDREPSAVRTCRAPEAFDYGRVLVAVPRDAPPFDSRNKGPFLDYACDFLLALGERTRGRMLVLFTNAADCIACGRRLEPRFRELGIPLWYQGMPSTEKEELAERFRQCVDSVLLGLDTFWYGADFPGPTLEYLVVVKLPYGVPDRYHHAQCAALGPVEQRRRIYLPRALAKFRQGFGRLMRKESDRGCVFLLDGRVLDPRHRAFLRELPLRSAFDGTAGGAGARLVRADGARCLEEAWEHMGLVPAPAEGRPAPAPAAPAAPADVVPGESSEPGPGPGSGPVPPRAADVGPLVVPEDDLPF